ncbi:MAG: sigma factor [Actinomycetota bacterium]
MDSAAVVGRRLAIGVFEPSEARIEELAAWFHGQHDALVRFGYVLTGSWHASEDLVQDAFVRIYRARSRVKQAGLPAYARTTMLHLARSRWRRVQREQETIRRAHDHSLISHEPVFHDVWENQHR